MNKEEQAIEELKSYANNSWGELNDSFRLTIKALEKQIGKRVDVIPEDDDLVYVRYECPMCEHILGYGNLKPFGKNKYCPKCGQKLTWR